MTLNFRHRLFIKHLFDEAKQDPVKAAAMAGYTNPKQAASKLLANRTISEYVERKIEQSGAMGVNEILARWSDIAAFDPTDFMVFTEEEKNGKTVEKVSYDLKKLKRKGFGHLIKKVSKAGGNMDVEFHSSMDAQDKLAKFYGMFVQRIEIEDGRDITPERVVALVDTLLKLKGINGGGTILGEPEPRALCVHFEQLPLEAGEASPVPHAEDGGCGGRPHQEIDCHGAPASWQKHNDVDVLPGMVLREEPGQESDPRGV
jgi:hypothetical protein